MSSSPGSSEQATLPAPGASAAAATQKGQVASFAFSKHSPDLVNRLMTEITGAHFVGRVLSKGKAKAADKAGDNASSTKAVDVDELLRPQKKRRAQPKRKATAKGAASAAVTETEADMQDEVTLDVDKDTMAYRPRCWVDDLLCCLAHAAGGKSPVAHFPLSAVCCVCVEHAPTQRVRECNDFMRCSGMQELMNPHLAAVARMCMQHGLELAFTRSVTLASKQRKCWSQASVLLRSDCTLVTSCCVAVWLWHASALHVLPRHDCLSHVALADNKFLHQVLNTNNKLNNLYGRQHQQQDELLHSCMTAGGLSC